jgi:2-oxoglutarate ferredoxin oxidoreductase subunit alpha
MTQVVEMARLMQGNEAIAEGALAAGVRFFAGYPITPSTEVAEIMAEKLPAIGGKFIQMEDEIASMAAIIGASLTGVKSMTATSGPGFSLKQENIGFACMTEVPCVVVNVQRSGPSSGIATAPAQGDVMQARWGTHGDHSIIALCPASVRECFDLTVKAVNLSEKYRVPVILLTDEVVGHTRERVVLPDKVEQINRKKPAVPPEGYYPYRPDADGVPPMANFGDGYRHHVTGLVHDETGGPTTSPQVTESLVRRLVDKIDRNAQEIISCDEFMMEDAEIVVFAYGGVARSAKRAIKEARQLGLKAGLFRPVTLWPFPEAQVGTLAQKVKAIIVPEMNLGQLRLEVERAAKGRIPVIGVHRVNGELIPPHEILAMIKEVR